MSLQKTSTSKKGYRSTKGKTVYAHMGIWKQKEEIHITIPTEEDFHTTVNNKDGSKRCHKNLYSKLKKLLEQKGCWE